MLIKSPQLIFINTLILGTLLACSSSSWVMAWVGLEVNLMSFIPLLINKLTPSTLEMTIKYFLTQAMGSMVIIFSCLCYSSFGNFNLHLLSSTLLSMALAMKAGVAPLHFWFPQIMAFANWWQCFILLTWQKIAPLILLAFSSNLMTLIFIMSSAICGMLGGFNQTNIKKILTFSSIIHSAWLITLAMLSDSVWWTYFLAYACLTLSIIAPFSFTKINLVNEINLFKMNLKNKILIFINLLSLAGLPPFLGFFMKMISLNLMISSKINILVIFTLLISSLIAFYFYSRLMYSTLLLHENFYKVNLLPPQVETCLTYFLFVSLAGNTFTSFLVLLT